MKQECSLPRVTEPPLHCGSVNTLTLAFLGNREETARNGQVGYQGMGEIERLATKFSRESRGSWHFLCTHLCHIDAQINKAILLWDGEPDVCMYMY
jgi:hypothetical protein